MHYLGLFAPVVVRNGSVRSVPLSNLPNNQTSSKLTLGARFFYKDQHNSPLLFTQPAIFTVISNDMHLSKIILSALPFVAASSAAPAQVHGTNVGLIGAIQSSYVAVVNAVYAGLTSTSSQHTGTEASGLFLRLTINSTKGYYYAVENDHCYGMIDIWEFLAERNLPVAALKTIQVVGREAKGASLTGFTENDCTGSEADSPEYPTWGSFEIVKS
ncbi:hypothetical protein MVEN_01825000 [Mycena venus]|uniref:Uncharacterized protein n=1 Tax=Mycena venus TaxID=2733690 RepID=A0A8H6XL34_9AGAR|nr:hypothetical protein MVEN_01825000 [Mycena venus]